MKHLDVGHDAALAIAKEAYIYGFPMVMAYKTMYAYTIDEGGPEYKAPFNKLACEARLLTPKDRAIVTPNADTPYCMAWLDLRTEPLVSSVPDLEPDRFYHVQLTDLYTYNFAYVGTLTTGNGAGRFLIAGPGWTGSRPKGIDAVIASETPMVFAIARTQLLGPDDLAKVRDIQGSYDVSPLSTFLGQEPPRPQPRPEFPEWVEGAQFDARLFTYLDVVMTLLEEPPDKERGLWERFGRIGLGPGRDYDLAALPLEIQDAIAAGAKRGLDAIEAFIETEGDDPLASAKIFGTREFLENSARENYGHGDCYLVRAAAAHIGLYGNSASEALYPVYFTDADGQACDGSAHRYTLTFEPKKFPPVRAFWSLTLYDGETQLLVENPLERYRLSSTMMDRFTREPDGSLVLHIAAGSPGPELESNWLPAPDGPFYMVLRLYGPEPEARDGRWRPPPLEKA